MKRIILILFPITLISLLVYKDLFSTFFQQDEWHAFGVILSQNWKYVTLDQSLFHLLFSGDRAGARFLMYLMFLGFGLNVVPYVSFSLGLHFLNSFLAYKITYKLLKNKKIAYLALFLFLFNGVSSQVYAWLGTFSGSVPNMTFLLLSLYVYLKFLLDKSKLLFVYLSLVLLWLSFLFKETGFFFLIFYPAIHFFYKKNFVKSLKINFPFIVYGFLLVTLRINEIFSPKGDVVNLVTSRTGLLEILLNAVFYPLQGFSQLIFPPNIIYPLSRLISSAFPIGIMPNTTEFDIFYQLKVAPMVSLAITFAFSIVIYKLIRGNSNKKYMQAIIFCLSFIFLSFIPYLIVQKGGAYLEPRYYYIGSLGSAVLLGIFLNIALDSKKTFLKVIIIAFFSIVLYFNISSIREDINFQKDAALERKYIIKTIREQVPSLPNKVVFYISGDAIGYYGLAELKVPFQSGLGQVLLVDYAYKKQISPKFLREESILKTQGEGFLYGILDQNYREIDGRGFGYFWDKNQMIDEVKKHNLSVDSVFAFFYKSGIHKLVNNTENIRNEL